MSEVFSYRQGEPHDANTIFKLWKGSVIDIAGIEALKTELNTRPSAVAVQSQGRMDSVVGFVYTSHLADEILKLENIFIHEDYRNRRLGTALLELVESLAVKADYRRLYVFSSDLRDKHERPNVQSDELYYKSGFELVDDTGKTRTFIKCIAG